MPKHCEYVQQLAHLKVPFESFEGVIRAHSMVKHWAYIIHDKDTYTEKDVKIDRAKPENERKGISVGQSKPPHVHLYLNFGQSSAAFDVVASWFNDGPQYVSNVKGRRSDVLKYLTHRNAPEKYQYDITEVHGNIDIKKEIEKAETEEKQQRLFVDILERFCKREISYLDAINLMDENRDASQLWDDTMRKIESRRKLELKLFMKKERNMEVIMIYGKSRTGKSTYANDLLGHLLTHLEKDPCKGICRSSSANDILQDYLGEDILILDDFRDTDEGTNSGYLTLVDVLKLLDPHFVSSTKSRFQNKPFTGRYIIITTTKDPLTWYEGTKEQRWQFFSRINKCIKLTPETLTIYSHKVREHGKNEDCGFIQEPGTNLIRYAPIAVEQPNPVPAYLSYTGKSAETKNVVDDILCYGVNAMIEQCKKDAAKTNEGEMF